MRENNKVFVLLPDGIGLRNFAYSPFYKLSGAFGYDLTYWNVTPFPLAEMGYRELPMGDAPMDPWTHSYKNARNLIEFKLNIRKSGDPIYNAYRFKSAPPKTFKLLLKRIFLEFLVATHSSERGLARIRKMIARSERKTAYYRRCLDTLQKERPQMIVCTNQRHISTIAPILAAKDLGIPTAAFIFSWDNLPKATMVIETDYYFVWSDLMKEQLMYYYPYIKPEQALITGTPQFEPHYDASLLQSREDFCGQYGLDPEKTYVAFTGDDVTSSPDDPAYLEDAANAVAQLNAQGYNIGIIFRRCPVDFSGRYDEVLQKYKHLITEILPRWKRFDQVWQAILPEAEDAAVFANVIHHTEMVMNLGSSLVFDYAAFGKPCAYFNYNQPVRSNPDWDLHRCYQFVHFRSMPSKKAIIWLDTKEAIASAIIHVISGNSDTAAHAQEWFAKINIQPANEASSRIWKAIDNIVSRHS